MRDWLAAHPRVQFHFPSTSVSWLNQAEGFFGILATPPFEWTKPANAIIQSHKRMLDRVSTAVH